MKKSILFVDDEKHILNSLRRVFIGSDYELYFAESGQEALNILSANKINLIITDMRMPGMDGIELLRKVKQQFPLTIRLLLSGYSDENLVFKAFQRNLCRYYMLKPWSGENLIATIDELFKLQEKLSSKEILSTINLVDKLPMLPDTYIKVNQLIDDEANLEDIAEVIEKDITLSLKILHIANSAFYNTKTSSIKTAVLSLGLTNVKNSILTNSLFDFFDDHEYKKKLLWEHALITNNLVTMIYKELLRTYLPTMYSSAGMLHDVGRIILCKNYPSCYMSVFELAKNKKISYTKAEKEVIGVTHDEIGAYLLDWWDIPTPIVESALYHETPFSASEHNRQLVAVVHISSYYAWKCLNIMSYESLNEDVFKYLAITKTDCEAIVAKHKIFHNN